MGSVSSERKTGPEQMISSVIRVMGLQRERWSDELFEKEREEGTYSPKHLNNEPFVPAAHRRHHVLFFLLSH